MNRIVSKLGPWITAISFLLFANGWLHEWAVERFIRPNYEIPEFPLQERTVGLNVLYVFDIFDARRQPNTKYFFLIGDSSVGSGMTNPATMLPTYLEQLLQEELGENVEVVLLSYPGLLVEDALLFLAEALAREPELVYYAVNPRIFADTTNERQRRAGLSGRVGGLAFARKGSRELPWDYHFRHLPLDRIVNAWVAGTWHMVGDSSAVRLNVHRYCRDAAKQMPTFLGYACEKMFPPPDYAPQAPPLPSAPSTVAPYVYRNADFTFDGGPAEAFRLIIDLCRRTGRCLLYQTPLNLGTPECERYFEPGLIDRYSTFITAAGLRESQFTDHTADLDPQRFMNERAGGCDVLHPDQEGRMDVARLLLRDTRSILNQRRERPDE